MTSPIGPPRWGHMCAAVHAALRSPAARALGGAGALAERAPGAPYGAEVFGRTAQGRRTRRALTVRAESAEGAADVVRGGD